MFKKKKLGHTCSFLIGSFIIFLCGCSDTTPKREIISMQTNTEDNINIIMDKIIDIFDTSYSDCTLLNVWYDGSQVEKLEAAMEKEHQVEDAIVVYTRFKTGKSENDGLNKYSEYDKYQWIFISNAIGEWEIVDRGY